MSERRALMQGDGSWWLRPGDPRRAGSHPPGTIAWSEHLTIWKLYDKRYPGCQTAEEIAQRGGFGYEEAVSFGHKPTTWEPRT